MSSSTRSTRWTGASVRTPRGNAYDVPPGPAGGTSWCPLAQAAAAVDRGSVAGADRAAGAGAQGAWGPRLPGRARARPGAGRGGGEPGGREPLDPASRRGEDDD